MALRLLGKPLHAGCLPSCGCLLQSNPSCQMNTFVAAFSRRAFASGDKEPQKKTDETTSPTGNDKFFPRLNETIKGSPVLLQNSLTGVGQVIFLNSKTCGAIIGASLAVMGDPLVGFLALCGSAVSTETARATQMNASSTANGLMSYNGCLVGCATPVFVVAPSSSFLAIPAGVAVTTAGAAASTFLTASLGNSLFVKTPQWTYAFNAVMLPLLVRLQPLGKNAAAEATIEGYEPALTAIVSTFDILATPLKGLSQIFVVESTFSGLGILVAISTYSPALASHALMGSTLGALTGLLAYGAPASDIAAGLWSYNACLTSMGVGVFFRNTPASWYVSAGGAVATTAIFAGLAPVFARWGAPCLTLPFCVTMSACYHLAGTMPGLELAKEPHSPERNQ